MTKPTFPFSFYLRIHLNNPKSIARVLMIKPTPDLLCLRISIQPHSEHNERPDSNVTQWRFVFRNKKLRLASIGSTMP